MKTVVVAASITSVASVAAILGLTAWNRLRAFRSTKAARKAAALAELAEIVRQESEVARRKERLAIEAVVPIEEAQHGINQDRPPQEPAQARAAAAADLQEADNSKEDAIAPHDTPADSAAAIESCPPEDDSRQPAPAELTPTAAASAPTEIATTDKDNAQNATTDIKHYEQSSGQQRKPSGVLPKEAPAPPTEQAQERVQEQTSVLTQGNANTTETAVSNKNQEACKFTVGQKSQPLLRPGRGGLKRGAAKDKRSDKGTDNTHRSHLNTIKEETCVQTRSKTGKIREASCKTEAETISIGASTTGGASSPLPSNIPKKDSIEQSTSGLPRHSAMDPEKLRKLLETKPSTQAGRLPRQAVKEVKETTRLKPDSALVREVLPGLFLARRKKRDLYPEDLLKKWGFNLAVQATDGDVLEKESYGVRCLVYNTSNGAMANDLEAFVPSLFSLYKEACRAERKVLFIPSNYTIAWVLAMMMKESYLSSSQAKQKLKAITGTDFAHTAFNRKLDEFGAQLAQTYQKRVLAIRWRGSHRIFVDCTMDKNLLAKASSSSYIIHDKGQQHVWLGAKASREDSMAAVKTGIMYKKLHDGLATFTIREGRDGGNEKLAKLLDLES